MNVDVVYRSAIVNITDNTISGHTTDVTIIGAYKRFENAEAALDEKSYDDNSVDADYTVELTELT